MQVEKKTIERKYKKVIREAHVQDIDSGHKREQKIIKNDGTEIIEHVPIMQRVFFEAIHEDAVIQQEVFVVKTMARHPHPKKMLRSPGGVMVKEFEEEHHFATKDDADRFIKITNDAKAKFQ